MSGPINVKQLETFVWIVRLGSFAAAAGHLCTTQSTVSFRIQELEEQLGVGLFDRSHHKARLTAKGHELLTYAEQVITLTSEIRQRIGDPKMLAGVVRVGVAEVVAKTWLPRLVTVLFERFPKVTLELDVGLTNALITRTRAGDLDLALIPGPVIEPTLVSKPLGKVDFVWMASPRLNIPRTTLAPRDLQDWPILSLSKDSHHYYRIAHWFDNNSAHCLPVASCNNMTTMGDLTIAGAGIGLLPACCYRAELAAKTLVILKTAPRMPAVEFCVIAPRGRFQPVTHAVISLAEEVSDFAGRG